MGKGDRRHSNKALQRKAQRKKKERLAKQVAEGKKKTAGKVTEKKPRARKAPAAPAAS